MRRLDGLDLTEEGADQGEPMVPHVPEDECS